MLGAILTSLHSIVYGNKHQSYFIHLHSPGSIIIHYDVILDEQDGNVKAIKVKIAKAVSNGQIGVKLTITTQAIIYNVHTQTKPKGKYDYQYYCLLAHLCYMILL